MIKDGKILIGSSESGQESYILPQMANRHGLITGATGTGKTTTIKTMAESFSKLGVPVFMADVKGDVAGMMNPGTGEGSPVALWDIYGKKGIQLRTTISEMGPLLLSRVLDLNETQSDILTVVFKIADDNNLLLFDTKDLKSMLSFVDENADELAKDYGKIPSASTGVITRAIVALEAAGGDVFFGEPALNLGDWMAQENGKGVVNILDSSSLIGNGKLYSTFLLWLLSELFELLPEVGDVEKPKMVFFFDEAHLLFNDAPKALLEKVEQVVKLIRSKGVGVYFCSQNPKDIPDGVSAQLSNKIQHGLKAFTPAEQKSVKAAAESFRENPKLNTYDTILNLGTGEAVVSFLQEDGTPSVAEKIKVSMPECSMDALEDAARDASIKGSLLYSKYATAVDNVSAYEMLTRTGVEPSVAQEAASGEEVAESVTEEKPKKVSPEEKEAIKKAEAEAKAAQKEAEKAQKALEKEKEKQEKAKMRAVKSVASTIAGTAGRQMGKNVGKNFGKFGKTMGGNVGASLGRNLLGTLFKK